MTNTNNPYGGLMPVRKNGIPGPVTGRLVCIPASQAVNIFPGDPIYALGTSDDFGSPNVGIATAGAANPVLGTVLFTCNGPKGSGFVLTRDTPRYHQASVLSYAMVVDDPDQLYLIQEDSVGGAIAKTAAGYVTANLVAGTGSTAFGLSGWLLDSSSIDGAANTTFQLKVIDLLRGVDNALGPYAKWVVKLNNPQFASATGA